MCILVCTSVSLSVSKNDKINSHVTMRVYNYMRVCACLNVCICVSICVLYEYVCVRVIVLYSIISMCLYMHVYI